MSDSPVIADDPMRAWSRLWHAGVLHSCAHGIEGNYDGAIASFWRDRFGKLAAGDRVVDIGTGNGALPLLCKDEAASRGIRLEIHGVDLAAIDPASHAPGGASRYRDIVFHPRTSATALPFPDGSVRLVVSQYGFEYAAREPALREVLRIMGKHGRAAFVLHSHDSMVSRVTARQLEACSYLMRDSDIWERTHALVGVLASATTPEQRARLATDRHAEVARNGFNASAAALIDRADALQMPRVLTSAVQHLRNVIAAVNQQGAATAMDLLERSRSSLADEWQRLQQMHAATLDEAALAWLKQEFEASGHEAHLAPLDQAEGVRMGWTLVTGDG